MTLWPRRAGEKEFWWLHYPLKIVNLYSRWGEQIPTIKLYNLKPTQVGIMETFLKDAAEEKTRLPIFERERKGHWPDGKTPSALDEHVG